MWCMTSLGTDVSFHVALLVTLTGLVHHDGGGGPILLELVSIAGTSRQPAGSVQTPSWRRHFKLGPTTDVEKDGA